MSIPQIKPFLRWAGGKQWLAPKLAGIVPQEGFTYYEPFLGGGSLFFVISPQKAVLCDINERLIETYQAIRDNPNEIISILSIWKNNEETYYKIRATDFSDKTWSAAQLIYLNKTCWNGLYRVNREGKFNVPFGFNNRKVFDKEHILNASKVLKNAVLMSGDFEQILASASTGDFIYLDPPYTVLHSQNSFRRYNEKLFSWADQVRLAKMANELAARGCLVVVSNAANPEVLELYPDFKHLRVSRHSILAANPERRRKTQEALLVSSEELTIY